MRKFHVVETTRPDQITDALIRKALIRADGGVGCPDPSLLAGIHEGSLEPDETERWMTHLAACQRCQVTLGALARAEEDTQPSPEVAPSWWRKQRERALRWPVRAPLAALFIVPVMLRSSQDAIQWRAESNDDIERTDDGGLNWCVQLTVPERAVAGAAPSDDVAWMVGEQGLVLRTLDGEQRSRLNPPTDATVTTADGRQFRTVDAGTEWMLIH